MKLIDAEKVRQACLAQKAPWSPSSDPAVLARLKNVTVESLRARLGVNRAEQLQRQTHTPVTPDLAGIVADFNARKDSSPWVFAPSIQGAIAPSPERIQSINLPHGFSIGNRSPQPKPKPKAMPRGRKAPNPSTVDWRSHNGIDCVTPIEDQGQCGSCVAFATVAMLESMLLVEHDLTTDLSEADIFFCGGGDCNNGWQPFFAVSYAVSKGVPPASCFPYSATASGGTNISCSPCSQRNAQAARPVKSTSIFDINQRKTYLANVGPMIACFDVHEDFFIYFFLRSDPLQVYTHVSTGDVFTAVVGQNAAKGATSLVMQSIPINSGNGQIIKIGNQPVDLLLPNMGIGYIQNDNTLHLSSPLKTSVAAGSTITAEPAIGGHCVEIIGYDDSRSCWICKNSWGTDDPGAGFFRIGYGQCGIDTDISILGLINFGSPFWGVWDTQITTGFGNISSDPLWTGNFTGAHETEVLFYFHGDGHWWLGSYVNGQIGWNLVSQTRNPKGTNFGDTSKFPTWIGDFTGSGHSQVLFYSPGDDNWWLGSYSGNEINWSLAGNTRGFGHSINDGRPFWTGNFSGIGRSQIMFYFPGDGHWWLGSYANGQIGWDLVSQTRNPKGTNFADTSKFPTWIGDFTGSGHSQVLFYSPGDGHWWLGSYANGQIEWHLVSRTQNPKGTNFGDTSKFPTWIGDFTGSGHSQVLFYSPGDGHWRLGSYSKGQIGWHLVSQTRNPKGTNFGDTSKFPTGIGDFTGIGHSQVLFYSPGDDNLWLGSYSGNQINWSLAGNTRGFRHGINEGRPFWTGNFSGIGRSQIMFYFPGDGNWWLGTFEGTQLTWALAGNTGV